MDENLEYFAREEWRSSFSKLGDDEIGAVTNVKDNALEHGSSHKLNDIVTNIESFANDDIRFESSAFKKIGDYLHMLYEHVNSASGVTVQFAESSLGTLLTYIREHAIQYNEWFSENQDRIAKENHDEIYNPPADDYDRYGLKRSDF